MCDKIKVIVFKYYGKYLHLYLITILTKVIAIVFVFENFIAFVIVFKYYAMYLDSSLDVMHGGSPSNKMRSQLQPKKTKVALIAKGITCTTHY